MEDSKISRQNALQIKSSFDAGDPIEFFKAWEKIIPQDIKWTTEFKTLTLYMFVYFTTVQLKSTNQLMGDIITITINTATDISSTDDGTEVNESNAFKESEMNEDVMPDDMQMESKADGKDISDTDVETLSSICCEQNSAVMELFKLFLIYNGSKLSAEPEYLPYFALPFIHDPINHPAFKEIFQDDWVKKLRDRLEEFLTGITIEEEILVESLNQSEAKENLSTVNGLHDCSYKQKYKQLRQKFNKLRVDHKSVVGVANELAVALEDSVKGEAVDLKETLEKCFQMYPDLFSRPEQSYNQADEASSDILKSNNVDFAKLDWSKIKQDLMEANVSYKLCLLQALRWGVTGSKGNEAVEEMAKHDLLEGVVITSLLLPAILTNVEDTTIHSLQEASARLTNALASQPLGRCYIGQFIDTIVTAALSTSTSTTLDMLVASLYKLSLEKCRSRELVSRGVLEWALVSLNNKLTSDYFQKYAVSLLMNLCFSVPQDQWAIHPNLLVPTLILLLNNTHCHERLENVLGCLYSLLKSDELNREFNEQGLESALSQKMETADEPITKRLQLLIEIHTRSLQPHFVTTTYDQMPNNMENILLLDPEIDDDDLVHGNPCGTELLKHYILQSSSGGTK